MASSTTIQTETDAGTMADLSRAIAARSQALGKSTEDSTVAASIMILRSLKASTKKAKSGDKAPVKPAAYKIVRTDMYGGYYGGKGARKVCARIGSHYGHKSHIRPAMGFKASDPSKVLSAVVYAIYTTNPYDRFEKNLNNPALCWYVLCEHEGQAVAYAQNHIRRILSHESGLAKYALGLAQAQASTRSKFVPPDTSESSGGMSPSAVKTALSANVLNISANGFGEGEVTVEYLDRLNYSKAASGGQRAMIQAIDKASRQMIAYSKKLSGAAFPVKKEDVDFKAAQRIPWNWS